MSHYYGRVEGGVVVLPPDVSLADGSVVEVRLAGIAPATAAERAVGRSVKQRLVEAGLLLEVKDSRPPLPAIDRTPILVEGKPLSETIIEERR